MRGRLTEYLTLMKSYFLIDTDIQVISFPVFTFP